MTPQSSSSKYSQQPFVDLHAIVGTGRCHTWQVTRPIPYLADDPTYTILGRYYAIPVGAFILGYTLTNTVGFSQVSSLAATLSGLCCIGGIAGLSTQKTARAGNVSGMAVISHHYLPSAIITYSSPAWR